MHLNELGSQVKEGVEAAGLVSMRFNTIGVSDGISMGTDGMSFSLQSRDLIADSIETAMSAHWYDANISIPGCDKTCPVVIIAMGRLNRPSLMIYGGTIRAGCIGDNKLDIVSAFQSYGEYLANKIDDETRRAPLCATVVLAQARAAACTRPTRWRLRLKRWACHCLYSSSTPADSAEKSAECVRAGAAIRLLLERNLKPRDIMTRAAFNNAITTLIALGGSTNAVLHLIAMARAVDVP